MVRYDIIYPYEGELKHAWFTSNRPTDKEVLPKTYDESAVRENAFKTLNDMLVREGKNPLLDINLITYTLSVVNN
jgi:hypothetical protein